MKRPSRSRSRASKAPVRKMSDAKRIRSAKAARSQQDADLRKQLDDQIGNAAEARARQEATAEILKIIATSPSDPQRVLNAIAESARELTGALYSGVARLENGLLTATGLCGWKGEALAAIERSYPRPATRDNPLAVAILDGKVQNVADIVSSGVE
jgi:hypothetical protein